MTTARDILKRAVDKTDIALRGKFGKSGPFIRFTSGRSQTIENEITILSTSLTRNPFPLVAMFTEGMYEWKDGPFNCFRIPKIAIVIRTKTVSADEAQKLHDSFSKVLHPIYEEFERQLNAVNHGYGMRIEHFDLPCMNDQNGKTSLNQLCDAVIIRNLQMKYIEKKC